MDLMLRIRANAAEALTAIKTVHEGIAKVGHGAAAIADYAKTGFGYLKTAIGWVLKPLELAAKGVIALGFAFAGLITKSLWAAAAHETLVARLTAVYGSAEKATQVFTRLEAAERVSSHTTDDLTDAMITLHQYGLDTESNLFAAANAAEVMGESVGQVAFMISALQARGFKKFGIDVDEKNGMYVIEDMKKGTKQIAANADAARKALFNIMGDRFGTTLKPTGLSGFTSALRHAIDQAFSNFGGPLLKTATNFVQAALGKVTELLQSGKLEEWGKKVSDALIDAAGTVLAVFRTGKEIFDKGPDGMMAAFKIIAPKIGQTIVIALIEYLLAMKDIFFGIGKLIGAGLMEMYMASKMPGAEAVRNSLAQEAGAKAFTHADVLDLNTGKIRPGAAADENIRKQISAITGVATLPKTSDEMSAFIAGRPEDQKAKIASLQTTALAVTGFGLTLGAIPGHARRASESINSIWADAKAELKAKIGIDFDAINKKSHQDVRDWANAKNAAPAIYPQRGRPAFVYPGALPSGGSGAEVAPPPAQPFRAGRLGRGTGSLGGNVSSASESISIGQLTVRANESRQLQNKIIRHSMGSGLAAAAY